MVTVEQLKDMLLALESENIERTRAFDKADKMGQAISAFANDLSNRQVAGYLLLGVENNGMLSKRRVDDDIISSLGSFKTDGLLLPPPSMSLEVFHLDEGDVVVIEVFPSKYPPIRYKGQAWVRVGARKALATDEDIHLLTERGNKYGARFEELPCETASIEDMDLELFKTGYLPRAIAAEVIDDDPRTLEEQLASLRFYDKKTKSPTNLGMILFGKHPELYIPSSYIQYVKFSDEDNGSDILLEHAYKGPLLSTISDLNGFIKAGLSAVRPVLISPLQEKSIANYPDWAIRELLLNAIIHRDYQIGNAPIKFYEYNNSRLEISNPGGLYGQANRDNFPFVNDYRNPLLAEAMKIMGYVNKFNRGIAKVKTELEKNGNPSPAFDLNHITEFRVTVIGCNNFANILPNGEISGEISANMSPNGKINGEINANMSPNGEISANMSPNGKINGEISANMSPNSEMQIYNVISKNPGIKREGLLLHTGISLRTIDRLLKRLKDSQKVEYRGSRKTGGWYART